MKDPDEPELLEKKEGWLSRTVLVIAASIVALAVVLYMVLVSIRTSSF